MVYVKPYILDPAVVVTNMILNIRAGRASSLLIPSIKCVTRCQRALYPLYYYIEYYETPQLFDTSSSLLQCIRWVLTSLMRQSAYLPTLRSPNVKVHQHIESRLAPDTKRLSRCISHYLGPGKPSVTVPKYDTALRLSRMINLHLAIPPPYQESFWHSPKPFSPLNRSSSPDTPET